MKFAHCEIPQNTFTSYKPRAYLRTPAASVVDVQGIKANGGDSGGDDVACLAMEGYQDLAAE